jgi:nitroreductase
MDIKKATTDHPVHDLIASRWSPYVFSDREVEDGELCSIFEAARWAPSSYNAQPWRYLVARRSQAEAFERMLSCLVELNRMWAAAAPVLAIGVVHRNFEHNGKPNKASEHDLGLASAGLSLQAAALGLSVHQMIGIEPQRVREVYGLPEDFEAFTALAIGYAGTQDSAPEPLRQRDEAARARKPLPEIVFGRHWGQAADWIRGG